MITVFSALELYVLNCIASSLSVKVRISPGLELTSFISSNPIEYFPEITSSSSHKNSSAGIHSTSFEFLAIKPPSKAPAPATIKPVPNVVPITPTVAAAPINPPCATYNIR